VNESYEEAQMSFDGEMPSVIARSPVTEALTPGKFASPPNEEISSSEIRNKLLLLDLL
jgi:hypothetical protein